ncbi:MAG TPA: TRAP transporter permease [Rhodocyclaceae bacterium]|nr:TRAP transporter permease [Rhodocyclaceae bacterium]
MHGTAGPAVRWIDPVACIALAWVAFHLWVASPLPIEWGVLRVGETGVRALHLAFAILLAFLLHPLRRDGTARGLRLPDLLVAALAAFCAAYLYLFYARISAHPGDPAAIDVAVATVGLVLLLEATRRLLGWSMVVLALVLLAYILFGAHAPALIAHKSASVGKAMSHLWLSTEGVFGVALGVSAGFIFLFVVFGALLEAAGGGQYLVRGALSLVGHLRGGPAKAAVGVSAATGLVSGSSITNVVTTGPLTIPLVKRIGYPPEKAAAIEVAASINGQVMPPVMGAAAFLMVAYVGIPYLDVLKHALISALVAYLGLLYIVHLEAVKAGLRGLPRLNPYRWRRSLARFAVAATAIAAGAAILSAVVAGVRAAFPNDAAIVTAGLLLLAYLLLLRLAAPHILPEEVAAEPIRRMPDPGPALKSGLHFLLPIGLLVWNLIIERLSPADAVFRATIFLIVIVLTQRPLLAWLRGERSELGPALRRGVRDLLGGLVAGARGMVAIAIATATAGIVVGTLTLTGVGLIMTELIEVLTGGNVLAMLVFVALVCLVLGMGLPTTASYIVVSSLMAPVILTVGAQNGLPVPLIAAHLFVFYFGVLADALPPGGLATYAAASIAGANPLRTGVVAFRYSMRMALLPFMFVLNPELLLIGVHGVGHALLTVLAATLAGFVFISVNQAWLICRTRASERLLLLLATIMLFHPGLFMDPIHPAHRAVSGDAAVAALAMAPSGARMRVVVEGVTLEGREVTRVVLLPLGAPAPHAEQRLAHSGVTASRDGDTFTVLAVTAGGMAAKLGVEPGFRITAVEVAADRPAPQWMFVIALTLIVGVAWRQRRRSGSAAPQAG